MLKTFMCRCTFQAGKEAGVEDFHLKVKVSNSVHKSVIANTDYST